MYTFDRFSLMLDVMEPHVARGGDFLFFRSSPDAGWAGTISNRSGQREMQMAIKFVINACNQGSTVVRTGFINDTVTHMPHAIL